MRRFISTVSTSVARALELLGQFRMGLAQLLGDGGDVHADRRQVGAQFVVQLARQAHLLIFADADQVARQHRQLLGTLLHGRFEILVGRLQRMLDRRAVRKAAPHQLVEHDQHDDGQHIDADAQQHRLLVFLVEGRAARVQRFILLLLHDDHQQADLVHAGAVVAELGDLDDFLQAAVAVHIDGLAHDGQAAAHQRVQLGQVLQLRRIIGQQFFQFLEFVFAVGQRGAGGPR
jgi:hypothetical protein